MLSIQRDVAKLEILIQKLRHLANYLCGSVVRLRVPREERDGGSPGRVCKNVLHKPNHEGTEHIPPGSIVQLCSFPRDRSLYRPLEVLIIAHMLLINTALNRGKQS